jgi:Zinc finger, C2H2 type
MPMAEVCAECGKDFATAADLVEHVRAEHAQDSTPRTSSGEVPDFEWHVCGLCGARFRDPRELAQHNLLPHDIATHAVTSAQESG